MHLNVYHNLSLLQNALRHKRRSFYVHNTHNTREIFAQLQKYGYISRFLAVHEPFSYKKTVKARKRTSPIRKEVAPYLLIFLKYRLSNKALPVIGSVEWNERPVAVKRPYPTNKMGVYRQGMGIDFVEYEKERFMPAYMAKLRGIHGCCKGFRIHS